MGATINQRMFRLCPQLLLALFVSVLLLRARPVLSFGTNRFGDVFTSHRSVRTKTRPTISGQVRGHLQTSRYLFNEERKSGKDQIAQEESNQPAGFLTNVWRKRDETSVASTDVNRNVENTAGMPDLLSTFDAEQDESTTSAAIDIKTFALGFVAVLSVVAVAACASFGLTLDDVVGGVQSFVANPQASLQDLLDKVESVGDAGPVYFGVLYFLAEILAIPATPLTMSAGFLFGVVNGSITVLIAATFAASFSFVVGKTVLRQYVETILDENPKYAKIDKAIGEQGFPLLFLIRLTPLFPFALSNYVYGASSIRFADYFWGTLLGFAPGTVAYVYTGQVGQTLTTGEGSQPWYVYVGALCAISVVLKLVTDVASGIVGALDEE